MREVWEKEKRRRRRRGMTENRRKEGLGSFGINLVGIP